MTIKKKHIKLHYLHILNFYYIYLQIPFNLGVFVLQVTVYIILMVTTLTALIWSWIMRPSSSTSPWQTDFKITPHGSPSLTQTQRGHCCTGPLRPMVYLPCSQLTGMVWSDPLQMIASFNSFGTLCTKAMFRSPARMCVRVH